MFRRHVLHNLGRYLHGELTPRQRGRVEAHLNTCQECREEWERFQAAHRALAETPLPTAPEGLWERIEARLPAEAPQTSSARFPLRMGRRRTLRWAAAFGVLLLMVGGGLTLWKRSSRPSLVVDWLAGPQQAGRLRENDTLETDGNSRARILIPNMGQVTVEPNTKIQLLTAKPREVQTGQQREQKTELRLELQQGEIHAKIAAPPRLFFVKIPKAEAIDMGCAYTLSVDKDGNSVLRVTSGAVLLVRDGKEIGVPAGATCETRVVGGTGTPVFNTAPQALRDAVHRYDFEQGDSEALKTVMAKARPRDTLTLWYLFLRVPERDRGQVFDKLEEMVPAPASKQEMLKMDPALLDAWKAQMEQEWVDLHPLK